MSLRTNDRGALSPAARLRTALGCAALLFVPVRTAQAAGAWVDRPITLPGGTVAIDPGLGVGTAPRLDLIANSYTGAAMNLEASWGILEHLEVGLRTGIRLDFDGRVIGADSYARTYDLQTFGTRIGNPANPELRGRYSFWRNEMVELAGELRLYVPIETGSREGFMLGLPVAVHLNHFVRIDGGVYLPVVLYTPTTYTAASFPVQAWFQASEHFWLGPTTGVSVVPGGPNLVLGVGFGVQAASWVDVRLQIVDPALNRGVDRVGLGIGAEFRIE